MQLGDEDGGLETNHSHARAIFQVPENALPVLGGAEEEAVIGRPAQRLDLARVATELAGDAVRLNVEDYDQTIMLREALAVRYERTTTSYPAGCKQVTPMAESNCRRVPAACGGCEWNATLRAVVGTHAGARQ